MEENNEESVIEWLMKEFTADWNENRKSEDTEYSISMDDLEEFARVSKICNPIKGAWVFFICAQCEDHGVYNSVHVKIVDVNDTGYKDLD